MAEAKEYFEAIKRPLTYVQSGDPKRLRNVKNLSHHVLEVSRQALSLSLCDRDVRTFRALQELFFGI